MADPFESAHDRGWDDVIRGAVERLPKKARRDGGVVEDAVRSAARKVFAPARKPVVKVHIARV
jgi:hypothetical protein